MADQEHEHYTAMLADIERLFDTLDSPEAVLRLLPFCALGAAKLVVEKVYGREMHIRVLDAAMGVVRQEQDALSAAAPRYASDAEGWAHWTASYYGRHALWVANQLGLTEEQIKEMIHF